MVKSLLKLKRRNEILTQISLIRDQKMVNNAEHNISKMNKDIYDIELQLVNKGLNLKGLLTLHISREQILS